MLLVATTARADFVVRYKEMSTGKTSSVLIRTAERRLERKASNAAKGVLPQIDAFSVQSRRLKHIGRGISNAEEILYQSSVDGYDVAVVREEYNSFASPWRLIAAMSGHPSRSAKSSYS
jgi:hypothetical protein